jgi:hypothetical protein
LPPLPKPAVAAVRTDDDSRLTTTPLTDSVISPGPLPSGRGYLGRVAAMRGGGPPSFDGGDSAQPKPTSPDPPRAPARRDDLQRLLVAGYEMMPELARPVISALAYVDPPRLTPPPAEPRVDVNRAELRARIAGTNLALRALEAEIDRRRAWPIGEVAAFTTRLRQLATRCHDLRLFLDLLDEPERRLFEPLRSPLPVVAQLGEQLAAARRRIAPDDRSRDAMAHRDMLDHLHGELESIRQLLDAH